MDDKSLDISTFASSLGPLIQEMLKNKAVIKCKKKDIYIQQLKKLIILSISSFFHCVKTDSDFTDASFTAIKVLNEFFESKKSHSIPQYLQKYFLNVAKFMILNLCFNSHYKESFEFLQKIAKSEFISLSQDHKIVFYYSFLTVLINLASVRGPESFLGGEPISFFDPTNHQKYVEIQQFCRKLKENSIFLPFLNDNEEKYIGRVFTEMDKLHFESESFGTLSFLFGKNFIQIYQNQNISSPYFSLSSSALYPKDLNFISLQQCISNLIFASRNTPFNLLDSYSRNEINNFFPANPPFAFEREVINKMGISIDLLCPNHHILFLPFNGIASKPIFHIKNKCPFCISDDNTENFIHSYETEMFYSQECDPYKTDYLQEIGPLGPLEAHILRIIFLAIDLNKNHDSGRHNFYKNQIMTCIKCISIMLFPHMSFHFATDAAFSFVLMCIKKMIPIVRSTKLLSELNFSKNSSQTKVSAFVPPQIIFSAAGGKKNVHAFRELFAQLMDYVFLTISLEKNTDKQKTPIFHKISQKNMHITSTKTLLTKFLLSRQLRQQYPLCYHFLRLSSQMDKFGKILPLIKNIQKSLKKQDFCSQKFRECLNKLANEKMNDLLTNEMRNQATTILEDNTLFSCNFYGNISNWFLPELVFSFINPHNEFVSFVNKQTNDISMPCDVKLIQTIDDFPDFNKEEIANVIIQSSLFHFCSDSIPNITTDTETALLTYLKQRSVPYLFCDIFSDQVSASGSGMTITSLFKSQFGFKPLNQRQKLFITYCVTQRGKSSGLILFFEKIMQKLLLFQETKDDTKKLVNPFILSLPQSNLIDFVNHQLRHSDDLVFSDLERESYKSFLDVKLHSPATVFTIQHIPSIIELLEEGKQGFGCSLTTFLATVFMTTFLDINTNIEMYDFDIGFQKEAIFKQIEAVSIMIVSYCICNIDKCSSKTKISAVLESIDISSFDSYVIRLFNQIKETPVLWCVTFLNNIQ